jgi:hypothetical protein
MARYTTLLTKAVESISHSFRKRVVAGLFSGRGGQLLDAAKQAVDGTDFDLVSWLVIKSRNV